MFFKDKRTTRENNCEITRSRKRTKTSSVTPTVSGQCHDFLDTLPDDIVLVILKKLASTAASPSDFLTVLSTCKRLNTLGSNSHVLAKASQKVFAVKPEKWSESSHRFLKSCSDSGNVEACYTLGM
nr:F-box protein At1g67340-like [Tanacetum cinerariifolium]